MPSSQEQCRQRPRPLKAPSAHSQSQGSWDEREGPKAPTPAPSLAGHDAASLESETACVARARSEPPDQRAVVPVSPESSQREAQHTANIHRNQPSTGAGDKPMRAQRGQCGVSPLFPRPHWWVPMGAAPVGKSWVPSPECESWGGVGSWIGEVGPGAVSAQACLGAFSNTPSWSL